VLVQLPWYGYSNNCLLLTDTDLKFQDTLKRLYESNHQSENWDLRNVSTQRKHAKDYNQWSGPLGRRLVQAVYTLAFVCMLRIDEVLKIRFEDIERTGPLSFKLTLPFRKTNQFGCKSGPPSLHCQDLADMVIPLSAVQPFYLHAFPSEWEHLCPVRALMEWINATQLNEGYVFRKVAANDILVSEDKPTVSPNVYFTQWGRPF
jgi:hypothetical protein